MPSTEVVLFITAALVAGALTMGGVTLVYFMDKWRKEPSTTDEPRDRVPSPFDQAA